MQELQAAQVDLDINRALGQLKSQQRALLWLAYVEEFNHREIAEAAGVREKSVRVPFRHYQA